MRYDLTDLEALRDAAKMAVDTYYHMKPMSAEEKIRFAEKYPGVDMVIGNFKITKIRP